MVIFLAEYVADRYIEKKHGRSSAISSGESSGLEDHGRPSTTTSAQQSLPESNQVIAESKVPESSRGDERITTHVRDVSKSAAGLEGGPSTGANERLADITFKRQITGFAILESGIIFHSAIIGLALGASGPEFMTLFPVLVFHQSFEGLGIGARLSDIPFPKRLRWLPWALCLAYGATTPVAIAVALAFRTSYDINSLAGNVVSGVLDSTSAGILIYTALVELIAWDFLFDPNRPKCDEHLAFMVVSLFLGAGTMA